MSANDSQHTSSDAVDSLTSDFARASTASAAGLTGPSHPGDTSKETSSSLSGQIRQLLADGSEDGLTQLLGTLQEKNWLSQPEAESALSLLIKDTSSTEVVSSLFRSILTNQQEARRALPKVVVDNEQDVLRRCLASGPDSAIALTACLLAEPGWPSTDQRAKSLSSTVRLCTSELRPVASDDHNDLVLNILVRLVSSGVSGTQLIIDGHTISTFLGLLDIRHSQSVQRQALLVLMKSLDAASDEHSNMVKDSLFRTGSSRSSDDLVLAFSAAAALFPILTQAMVQLVMAQNMLHEVSKCLKASAGMVSQDLSQPLLLRDAALTLLSAACIDKTCRAAIKKDCATQLRVLVDDHDPKCAAVALLILVKTGSSESDAGIVTKTIELALRDDANQSVGFEALAYLSLLPKVKQQITADSSLLAKIVGIIRLRNDLLLSCTTILVNLSAFRLQQTKEQEKLAQLKAYAEASRPQPDDRLDNDTSVLQRGQKLIEAGVVPPCIACAKVSQSPTILGLTARLLHALTRQTKQRSMLVREGAIGALLRIREVSSRTDASASAQAVPVIASHALARILISVNPAHAFAGVVSAGAVVSALVPLLSPILDDERRDWLPTFEALLALTNLASTEDDTSRNLIVSSSWTVIENDLLLANNTLVQRACVELICNLMQSPSVIAKFGDGSQAASRRLHILLALTDVSDLATRRGAGGALAMLTGWQGISTHLLEQAKALSLLLKLATDADEDTKHRGLVCIMNVVSAPESDGEQGRIAVKAANGDQLLRDDAKNITNPDLLSINQEILQLLT